MIHRLLRKGPILMNESSIKAAGQAILTAEDIALVAHVRPDGDAIGSVLGLGRALEDAGKKVQMILADGVPDNLKHLPGADRVRPYAEPAWDLLVSLDCSDPRRFGPAFDASTVPDINIDHHVTNLNFGRINLVDAQAVATTAILVDLIPEWGLAIRQPTASALLTGMITDTLGFRTPNMTSRAMQQVGQLMDLGAPLPELYRLALIERSLEATRLWGEGLDTIRHDGRMIWATITLEARERAGYPGLDDAEMISVISGIRDHDIFLVFSEQPYGEVKVSWRASPGYDVSNVALDFGGGGHPAAAGATIKGGLDQVQSLVLEATERMALASEVEI
jgi:phosphoesterase RecJ-like protein